MQKVKRNALGVLLILLLVSCTYNVKVTHEQLATIAMNTYSREYDSWLNAVIRLDIPAAERQALIDNPETITQSHIRTNFTPYEVEVLQKLRKVLREAKPVITSYDTIIKLKTSPPSETAVKVLEIVQLLIQAQIKRGGEEPWRLIP